MDLDKLKAKREETQKRLNFQIQQIKLQEGSIADMQAQLNQMRDTSLLMRGQLLEQDQQIKEREEEDAKGKADISEPEGTEESE